ncbi:MAG TPA: glycosyltransferase family 2 protein [Candidatus Saccharimonadia bacterium]|nr:glycosyltransferase family 2 protein [Candidatus Saccharimonadia bacterium]
MAARLSIIILNHNTEKLVAAALRSVQELRQPDWEVIVVDNASTDNSVAMMKKAFPWVEIVVSTKNLGFAGGNNLGLKKATGTYIILLNSDALFTRHGKIETLLSYLDTHDEVGIVAPKVTLPNGHLDRAAHRGFPTPWNAFTYFSKLEHLTESIPLLNRVFGGYHMTWLNTREPHEIDACTGAAMIVRAAAMKKVGLLDQDFFMYGEDIDWCYRFKEAGWRIMFHPGFEILHLKHQSGMKRAVFSQEDQEKRAQTTAQFFDTMKQFYRKHYAQKYPSIVMRAAFFGIDLLQALKGA